MKLCSGGLSFEFCVPCDSVVPNWEVWRADDTVLVPDRGNSE